uniref:Uncharacterized protein n=1 Tax=Sphingobacterium sp. (strain 21) TaxID=743722 RepID=F4C6D9_SPHS2
MIGKERNDVFGKNVANAVLSMSKDKIFISKLDDKQAAINRIQQEFRLSLAQAETKCEQMIGILENAELTINFYAHKLFPRDSWLRHPSGDGFKNTYELTNSATKYTADRDATEESIYHYSNVRKIASRTKSREQGDEIRKHGKFMGEGNMMKNIHFESSSRPVYAAMNFAGLKSGAASAYGKSYAVLKEEVKARATFIHEDSLVMFNREKRLNEQSSQKKKDIDLSKKISSTANFYRLIFNMDRSMLLALERVTTDNAIFSNFDFLPNLDGSSTTYNAYDYIEAHIHGGVKFESDVKAMYVSTQELYQNVRLFGWHYLTSKRSLQNFAYTNNSEITFI